MVCALRLLRVAGSILMNSAVRRFVDQFRISELAPLSGNRCTLGVGNSKG